MASAATIARVRRSLAPLLVRRGPDVLRRARRAGDHRFRRSVLRRGRARDGRVGRLADPGLQLRAALPEADPLLLARPRRPSRWPAPGPGAARLWSALAGVGLVFVTAGLARRWYDDDTALVAGAIVATSFGYVALARMALPDLPLALFITVTIGAALVAVGDRVPRPAPLAARCAALAAALGFLTKGPLAVVHPGLVVAPIVAIERRASRLRRADLVAAAVALRRRRGAVVPRHVVAARHRLPERASSSATTSSASPPTASTSRGRGGTTGRSWSAAWCRGRRSCCSALGALGRMATGRGAAGSLETRLAIWIVLPLVLLTISVGKQPRYVLPLMPPLALLLAHGIVERTRARRGLDGGLYRQPPDRLLQGTALARRARPGAGRRAGVAGAAALRRRAAVADLRPPRSSPWPAASRCVATALSRRWRDAPWVLAWATAVAMPALIDRHPRRRAGRDGAARWRARSRRRGGPASRSACRGVFVRNLVFYTGVRQIDLIDDAQLDAFLRQDGRALVVVPADVLERVEAAGAPPAARLARVPLLQRGRPAPALGAVARPGARRAARPAGGDAPLSAAQHRGRLAGSPTAQSALGSEPIDADHRSTDADPSPDHQITAIREIPLSPSSRPARSAAVVSHILPGLRMPCGSKACLTRAISAISAAPAAGRGRRPWRSRCRARR